jgi:hypothetical protein
VFKELLQATGDAADDIAKTAAAALGKGENAVVLAGF